MSEIAIFVLEKSDERSIAVLHLVAPLKQF